ncbi:MAG: AEC family transporter [Mycobacteriales bacterium]
MATTLAQLAPAFAGLFIGYLLRRRGVFSEADGAFLFRLSFYTCTPALAFSSLATVSITPQLLVFPLMAGVVASLAFGGGWLVGRRLRLTGTTRPTFVLACMIINSAFVLIFAQALYGDEGVARIAAFDAVNQCITFGWAYAVAAKHNPDHQGTTFPIRKILLAPPLCGIAAGVAVNLTNVTVPSAVTNTVTMFGAATIFLLTVATGILFAPTRTRLLLTAQAIGVRLVCGLVVGAAIIFGFGLDGMDATLVLMLSLTPVAFNCVTFASVEKLDAEFAAGALSVSLISSLVLVTAVALLLA